MKKVFIDIRLEKKLKDLRLSGKKGILAAEKAGNIIQRLQESYTMLADVGNTTKYGENRLKGMIYRRRSNSDALTPPTVLI